MPRAPPHPIDEHPDAPGPRRQRARQPPPGEHHILARLAGRSHDWLLPKVEARDKHPVVAGPRSPVGRDAQHEGAGRRVPLVNGDEHRYNALPHAGHDQPAVRINGDGQARVVLDGTDGARAADEDTPGIDRGGGDQALAARREA